MVTTSSTTGSGTTATSATTTPVTSASIMQQATKSLLDSVNAGSGVDSAGLVSSLVQAQFAAKSAQLSARSDTLTAQISGVSTLKSTVTTFYNALDSLVKGGTLASQPVSSNTVAVTAATVTGATLGAVNSKITVNALATAQTAVSAKITSASPAIDSGTMTLKVGSWQQQADGSYALNQVGSSVAITIDSSNNSLSGIAAAINAKTGATGVSASVVTDADGGAYLSIKGNTGTASAFQLTADDSSTNLTRFNVQRSDSTNANGTNIVQQAGNAQLTIDGVSVQRASNTVTDLVPGVSLSLNATGTTTLSKSQPTSALLTAVNDFVASYNEVIAAVKQQTDPITGNLRADPAAQSLLRSLQGLTSKTLLSGAASGTPATLGAIGVRTNRDGTLEVDNSTLTSALSRNPDAVESMFAYRLVGSDGVYGALRGIRDDAISTVYGLGASTKNYSEAQTALAKQQDDISTKSDAMKNRLTQQFAAMDARVNAYKSTQAFMKQQVDNWTKSS